MYGYESATGLGGLIAQAPANPYFARSMQIRDPGAMIVGDPTSDRGANVLPFSVGSSPLGGMVSASGAAVTHPQDQQMANWRQIFDWHNSPAPWVLALLLILYGYVHVSYRRGRVNLGGGL